MQSHRSGDVGLEVPGGSLDLAHVLVTAPTTSGLAFSLGYDGAAQYVAVQMDPEVGEGVAVRVTNAPGEPSATPATMPEIWNLTVIGGTPFFRKHAALGFEDAGGTVRNVLLVQMAVGVEGNAGACNLFASGYTARGCGLSPKSSECVVEMPRHSQPGGFSPRLVLNPLATRRKRWGELGTDVGTLLR